MRRPETPAAVQPIHWHVGRYSARPTRVEIVATTASFEAARDALAECMADFAGLMAQWGEELTREATRITRRAIDGLVLSAGPDLLVYTPRDGYLIWPCPLRTCVTS